MTPCPCDIVAIVAHPDDAELNCGGTLALAAAQGWRAAVVDLTRGELSTRGTPEIRAEEALDAARALGLTARIQLGLPDGSIEDGVETRRRVVDIIRRLRPRVVIAPPREDHHADHMAAGEIVARAMWLSGVMKYLPRLDPWRPESLIHYVGSRAAIPSSVVDISPVYDRRLAAIRAFRSQFWNPESNEPPTRIASPEFLDQIEGRARYFGFLIGAKYGEAFTSAEPIAVSRPVEIFGRERWENRPSGS
jgi:bacillithiol biosynthesis deacetylase BshB1